MYTDDLIKKAENISTANPDKIPPQVTAPRKYTMESCNGKS